MTPANPTPEPETPLTDAAVIWMPIEPDGEPQPFVPVMACAHIEKQLADTRRRLAEVEKERANLIVTTETLTKHMRSVMDSRNAYMCNSGKAELRAVIAEKQLTALRNAADGLSNFAKDLGDNWDCDTGANGTHPTSCRTCKAAALHKAYSALIAEGVGS